MHISWKVRWAGMLMTSCSQSFTRPWMRGYQAVWKQNFGEGRYWMCTGNKRSKRYYFIWIALLITELRKHEVVGNHQCFPLDEAWKKQETEFSCWGAWVLAHVWLGDMCTVRMQFFVCCHLSASSLSPTQRSGRHDIWTVFILTFTASTQLRS